MHSALVTLLIDFPVQNNWAIKVVYRTIISFGEVLTI